MTPPPQNDATKGRRTGRSSAAQGNLRAHLEALGEDDRRTLYAEQMEYARFHNGLVWQVSAVWVPLAFAGLAANYRDDAGGFDGHKLIFIGLASIFLLCAWTALAEWHRKGWIGARHLAMMVEAVWQLRPWPGERPRHLSLMLPVALGADSAEFDYGRLIRWAIAMGGIGVWVGRLIYGFLYCR